MTMMESALQQKALEQALAEGRSPGTAAADLSPQAMQRTIHELRVHQIELEIQNEELRRTQAELDSAQARYFDFYDLAPVGYLSVNEHNQILQANLATAGMLGVTRNTLATQPFSRFIMKDDQDVFYLLRKKMLASGAASSCELRLLRPDGTPVWTKIHAISATAPDGQPIVRLVLSDISERKQSDAALLAHEKFRDAILDAVPSQIAVLDRFGVILAVNQTWRRFAHDHRADPAAVDPDTHIGVNYLTICQAADGLDPLSNAARARDGILAVINGTQPSFYLEYPCHTPTEQCWFSLSVTPLHLQDPCVVVTHTDITVHRQLVAAQLAHAVEVGLATSRQRLRELVALNEATLEEERKHIAREVHDELGQVLTALRMDLSLLDMRYGALDTGLQGGVHGMKTLVDRAIQGVRNVATQLRPTALDMGLVPAIDWLCHEFVRLNGLPCFLEAPENLDIDHTRAVVVFRIVQESLTNITRYAQASQVQVVLRACDQNLSLQVSDNGHGFDLRTLELKKTFGLLGMRERAIALGGELTIDSSPGRGTTVDLSIPFTAGVVEVQP